MNLLQPRCKDYRSFDQCELVFPPFASRTQFTESAIRSGATFTVPDGRQLASHTEAGTGNRLRES